MECSRKVASESCRESRNQLLGIATGVLLMLPVSARAQLAVRDTAAQRVLRQAILTTAEQRFARAPGDTAPRVFRIRVRLADSLAWASFTAELMQQLHARAMTDADDRTNELVISELSVHGDTLIGGFQLGDRRRCPKEPWMGGATSYRMVALRRGSAWQQMSVEPTGVGDTRRCR